jgi:O-antigen/teichoic acid export membrane protein
MKRDAFWSALEAAVSALFSIATAFLIACIVGPSELGIAAAVTALFVLLWVVVNALFADALVQRAAIDHAMLSSAFWASTTAGCLALLAQAAAGPALATIFNDHRFIAMALTLAAPLPLVGAAGTIQGLLTRERAYRSLALRTLVGQGLGAATGIAAALAGAGAWALVLQQAVAATTGALALLLTRRFRPACTLDLGGIRSLLAVALPLTAATLVSIARYRLFAVLIGAIAGPAVLGQVHIAFRLVDTIRELAFTALWRLMLPAMSRHQHDRAAMLAEVDRWLRRSLAVMAPICTILAFFLTEIVALLMGPHWTEAAHAALPLIALAAWSTLTFPAGVALVATGQARYALYTNLAGLALTAAGILVIRPTGPWQSVMIWAASQILVSPYAIWANARALRVGILRPLTGGIGRRATR